MTTSASTAPTAANNVAAAATTSTTTTNVVNNERTNNNSPITNGNASLIALTATANVTPTNTTATTAAATTPTTSTTLQQQQSYTPQSSNRVMQADEDFNIRFVNLVRTHKCLYDKKVPEYRNRDNQEKSWSLISQETRESVIHCKERWRNLRACLSRYIKQQSGSEPQHKPYYLTEHMAFLLPFLKSTRNSLVSFQLPQQQHSLNPLLLLTTASQIKQQLNEQQQQLELKHSLSDNDDEETIDAFDPAITASLGLQNVGQEAAAAAAARCSPTVSDSASNNTFRNFIPDVQLAEAGPDLVYVAPSHIHHHSQQQQSQHHHHHHHNHITHMRRDSRDYDATTTTTTTANASKRIKTECSSAGNVSEGAGTSGQYYSSGAAITCYSGNNGNSCENTDMEFFRSILPDIAGLTPQQKRKFKIGILELIDDVVERYPTQEQQQHQQQHNIAAATQSSSGGCSSRYRRSSARDWRN